MSAPRMAVGVEFNGYVVHAERFRFAHVALPKGSRLTITKEAQDRYGC